MGDKVVVHLIFLHESILNHPYLCDEVVHLHKDDNGLETRYMVCTKLDMSHSYYLEVTALTASNEQRHVLLNHSFVVAMFQPVNLQNLPGFLAPMLNE